MGFGAETTNEMQIVPRLHWPRICPALVRFRYVRRPVGRIRVQCNASTHDA